MDPGTFITLPWTPQCTGSSSSLGTPDQEPALGLKILATDTEWSHFSLGHCEYHSKIYQWRPTATPASLWSHRDRKDIHHSSLSEKLYKDEDFGSMVLKLNASDNQGIGIIQGPNMSFASTRTIFKKGFKLMILDEADAMTEDAQDALKRVTEKFTENTRFCLLCNYLSKIIPTLQSCCVRFRFSSLTPELMVPGLK